MARQPVMPNTLACSMIQVDTGAPSMPVSGIDMVNSDIIQTRLRAGIHKVR